MILALALSLAACGPARDAVTVGLPPQPGHVTLLHTNDLHGHFLPEPADWIEGRPAIGGMVRIEQEVRRLRQERPRGSVLTLDGGDLLTGTPLTDLDIDGAKGGAMMKLLGKVGYDYWVIGNHDFDKGLDNLIALARLSPVPMLSSNVRSPGGTTPLIPKQRFSDILEVGDVRVGLIGATTDGLEGLMNRKDFARLQLLRTEETVREEVKRLEARTDLIVVLSHIGLDYDQALARHVPGIDVIVGAHSHTRLTKPERVNDTWIVQAGSYGRSLGVLDLVVENDSVRSASYELRDLVPETAAGAPNPELVALVDGWKTAIDGFYGQRLSAAPTLLGRSYHHESALGRWITDALRTTAEADVAFYNGGGLRSDLPAGEVTRGTLYACFPFNNEIKVFEMTGESLLGVMLRNAAAENDEKRGFLSLSGMRYRWKLVNGAPEIVEATIGGTPVDPSKRYVVATTSYIAEQWEKHLGAEPIALRTLPQTDFDAAVALAKAGPVVDPGDARAERVQ